MFATITIPVALGRRVLAAWAAEDGYYSSPGGFTPALPPHEGRCGFTGSPDGGRWLTSAGNCATVSLDADDAATIVVEGRRHGIQALLAWTCPDPADLAVLHAAPATCASTAPWPWWRTADETGEP